MGKFVMVKLVLIRHGQSIWNLENRFTGWADVPLSSEGIKQARKAGELLKKYTFPITFTSELLRAQETLFEILNENENENKFFRVHELHKEKYNRFLESHPEFNYTKIFVSEKLNERDYGDLEGKNKDDAREEFGEEQVHIWRRSYDIAPPGGECLKDTATRTLPYLKEKILPFLKSGNVLIAAHGNSLRSIIMELEKLTPEEILEVEVPTGTPIVYDLNENLEIINKEILG